MSDDESRVIRLHEHRPNPADGVAATLESLLERAKAGELHVLLAVCLDGEGSVYLSTAGDRTVPQMMGMLQMASMYVMLEHMQMLPDGDDG